MFSLLAGQHRYCNPERLLEGLSRLFNLYDEVETFVTFIGYSEDMDSLTCAMLDAHPEILIPQKYDIIGNWKMFQNKHLQELGLQKYMLFFHLQYLSRFQALFRNQTRTPSHFWLWTFKGDGINYNFFPGAWQGTINGKLKVKFYEGRVSHVTAVYKVVVYLLVYSNSAHPSFLSPSPPLFRSCTLGVRKFWK